MDWLQVLTIIGAIGAFMWYFLTRLEKDIGRLENDIGRLDSNNESLKSSFESWTKHIVAMQAEQGKRTDKLYQMFVDLLKEKK